MRESRTHPVFLSLSFLHTFAPSVQSLHGHLYLSLSLKLNLADGCLYHLGKMMLAGLRWMRLSHFERICDHSGENPLNIRIRGRGIKTRYWTCLNSYSCVAQNNVAPHLVRKTKGRQGAS